MIRMAILATTCLALTACANSGVTTKEIGAVTTSEEVRNPAGQSSFHVEWSETNPLAPKRVTVILGQDSDEFEFGANYGFNPDGTPDSIKWTAGVKNNAGAEISKALVVAAEGVAKSDDQAFTQNFGALVDLADKISARALTGGASALVE